MLTPKEIAYEVTKALDSKKGMDIQLLKIDRVSSLADYFLICTGTSNTHVKTLCDYAEYTMEQLGDSIHAVSDAMTQLLGTTTLNADQKLDEGRLQFKLAAAEARDAAGKRPSARETMAAIRAKAAEASEAARRASEDARLNAAEAANAARLAAKGTAERAAE